MLPIFLSLRLLGLWLLSLWLRRWLRLWRGLLSLRLRLRLWAAHAARNGRERRLARGVRIVGIEIHHRHAIGRSALEGGTAVTLVADRRSAARPPRASLACTTSASERSAAARAAGGSTTLVSGAPRFVAPPTASYVPGSSQPLR